MTVTKLRISDDRTTFEALVRSLYTSPYKACVREIIRNAVDAHQEAGIDRKVQIGETDNFLYVRDFGRGISPTHMKDIFSVIMKSTRTGEENSTGGHGLGSKTPFAVLIDDPNAMVFMNTVSDGVMYKYQASLDDEGFPQYTLLEEYETNVHSGVEYIIERGGRIFSNEYLFMLGPMLEQVEFIDIPAPYKNFMEMNVYSLKFGNVTVRYAHTNDDITENSIATTSRSGSEYAMQWQGMNYPLSDRYVAISRLESYAFNFYFDQNPKHVALPPLYEIDINDVQDVKIESTKSRDQLIFSNDGKYPQYENSVPMKSISDKVENPYNTIATEIGRLIVKEKWDTDIRHEFINNKLYGWVDEITRILLKDECVQWFDENTFKCPVSGYDINHRLLINILYKMSSGEFEDLVTVITGGMSTNVDSSVSRHSMNIVRTFLNSGIVDGPVHFAVGSLLNRNRNGKNEELVVDGIAYKINGKVVFTDGHEDTVPEKSLYSKFSDIHVIFMDGRTNKARIEGYIRDKGVDAVILISGVNLRVDDSSKLTKIIEQRKFQKGIYNIRQIGNDATNASRVLLSTSTDSIFWYSESAALSTPVQTKKPKKDEFPGIFGRVANAKSSPRGLEIVQYPNNINYPISPTYEELDQILSENEVVYYFENETATIEETFGDFTIIHTLEGSGMCRHKVSHRNFIIGNVFVMNAMREITVKIGESTSESVRNAIVGHHNSKHLSTMVDSAYKNRPSREPIERFKNLTPLEMVDKIINRISKIKLMEEVNDITGGHMTGVSYIERKQRGSIELIDYMMLKMTGDYIGGINEDRYNNLEMHALVDKLLDENLSMYASDEIEKNFKKIEKFVNLITEPGINFVVSNAVAAITNTRSGVDNTTSMIDLDCRIEYFKEGIDHITTLYQQNG